MTGTLLVICVLLSVAMTTRGQSYDNMTSLMTSVLTGYNTGVRPLQDQSQTVTVNLSLVLYNIIEVDTVQGVLTLAIGFQTHWYDERITWTPSDYGGISEIKIQQQYVWYPALVSSTPVEFETVGQKWMVVNYSPEGHALWFPGGIFKLSCPMNIKHWPYDEQTCDIPFFIYEYLDSEVLLQSGNIDSSFLQENGEWSLVSTSISSSGRFGKKEIIFSLKLQREVIFYLDTLLLPMIALSFLSSFVFLLPSESGERVSYCITLFLSMTVFLDVISDEVPKLSNPVPVLCQFLLLGVLTNAVAIILVVINMKLYHRSDCVPIGKAYRFIVWIARCRKRNAVGTSSPDQSQGKEPKKKSMDDLLQDCKEFFGETVVQEFETEKETDAEEPPAANKKKPECKITWKDVSIALDRLLFIGFFIPSILIIPTMMLVLHFHL